MQDQARHFLFLQGPHGPFFARLAGQLTAKGHRVTRIGLNAADRIFWPWRFTRTVSAMIARAGGVTVRPEVAQISLLRGNTTSQAWYLDLFNNPGMDIPVRNGDHLLIEADRRSFTALGATGTQNRVPF